MIRHVSTLGKTLYAHSICLCPICKWLKSVKKTHISINAEACALSACFLMWWKYMTDKDLSVIAQNIAVCKHDEFRMEGQTITIGSDVTLCVLLQNSRETALYVLDCIFSVGVVGSLVVFVWRGSWALLDIFLYPDDQVKSCWISLVSAQYSHWSLWWTLSSRNR